MSGAASATALAATAGTVTGSAGIAAGLAATTVGAAGLGTAGVAATVGAASSSLFSLGSLGTIFSIGSSLIGGLGSVMQGNSSAASARYNAAIAANNAQLAKQQADWASAEGQSKVGSESMKTRATVGAIRAAQAANNISVDSGSAVDVRSSAAELGELSAINIRANAARQAYGLQTQASNETAQSQLDSSEAGQDQLAGEVGGLGTVLSGVGSAGLNYSRFVQSGGI